MAASQILVVDADLTTAELVTGLFPSAVCSVSSVVDPDEALEQARTQRPIMVILNADLDSGYALCRRFKKDTTLKNLPVILISAEATAEQFLDHQRLPTAADAYLHKPLKDRILASVIIELIGQDQRRFSASSAPACESPTEHPDSPTLDTAWSERALPTQESPVDPAIHGTDSELDLLRNQLADQNHLIEKLKREFAAEKTKLQEQIALLLSQVHEHSPTNQPANVEEYNTDD